MSCDLCNGQCPECGDDLEDLRGRLHAAEKRLRTMEAALRERDVMWCKALTLIDPREIEVVTRAFNEMRDAALAGAEGEG